MTATTLYYLPTSAVGSTWTDPDNVLVADDAYASATVSRTLDYPDGYKRALSGYLSTGVYTGLLDDLSAGDSVVGVEISVVARHTRSDVDVYLRCSIDAEDPDATRSQLLSSTFQTYVFGGPTDQFNDDHLTGYAIDGAFPFFWGEMTSGNGESEVQIKSVQMRITWNDTHIDAIAFSPTTGMVKDTWYYSDIVTVAGMPGGFVALANFAGFETTDSLYPFQRTSIREAHQIQKNNDGKWRYTMLDEPTENGDQYQLRSMLNVPADTASPTLTIGGDVVSWSIEAEAEDNTPPAFVLQTADHSPVDTDVICSTKIFVSEVNAYFGSGSSVLGSTAAFVVGSSNPRIRINGGEWHTDAFLWYVKNGDMVEVSCKSHASPGNQTDLALFIGTESANFFVKT